MAMLRLREINHLEEFLEMNQGFVLNFSDRTFAAFFRDFELDIDSPPYVGGHSGSKANRMRSFWRCAPDQLVGDVIAELVEYAESYRPGHPRTNDCRKIASRLRGDSHVLAEVSDAHTGNIRSSGTPRVPVEVFFSYAHEDEDLMNLVRRQLVVRERLKQIVKWHDRMIPAGDDWKSRIDSRIRSADVILLFMSPHFLDSRYCYEVEGQIALRRHREGSACVIPVILRPCDWTATEFGALQALPRDGVPISQCLDQDQASLDVAMGVMDSIRTR